jgi:hypothetical protein
MTSCLTLLERYRSKGILVDTNILLLFFVGTYRRALISSFKRTKAFTPDDYDLLDGVLRSFSRIVTTPNILSEVSSLSRQMAEPDCEKYFPTFAQGIMTLGEEYVPSGQAAALDCFPRLGLTDSVILIIGGRHYLVLTDDYRLAGFLETKNVDVINFNHLRQYRDSGGCVE